MTLPNPALPNQQVRRNFAALDERFPVQGQNIADGAIGTDQLADDAVTAAKIATNAVTADAIAAGAVGSSEIATNAVDSAEIAADAVGSSEIAASAVGTSELAVLPAVRANRTSAFSIATSPTETAVPFTDADSYDTNAMHSTVTNPSRLTATVAGVYDIDGYVSWGASATGTRLLRIVKNGTTEVAADRIPAVNGGQQSISGAIALAIGDYVELIGLQSSGGNLSVVPAALSMSFKTKLT